MGYLNGGFVSRRDESKPNRIRHSRWVYMAPSSGSMDGGGFSQTMGRFRGPDGVIIPHIEIKFETIEVGKFGN